MLDALQALDLDKFLPYRLSVLAQLVSESLHDIYAGPYGLSVTQWRVMAALGHSTHLTASEVSRRIVMDKVAVSRAVAGLTKRGLVERATDVAAHEAGGITQHIGAYQVTLPSGQKITFLDTPGHEAFTAMRARGAKVTDIVILVVAADDGVMPQTVEAIVHARAAKVPIIVAINKVDKGDANPLRVKTELLQHEIQVEELGGDVLAVEVSAVKGIGLEKLEEAILLQSEVLDLRANPKRPAEGAVIEAKLDKGRGPVATVLVQRGTLKHGDLVVAGAEWGRVRALVNERGETVEQALPGEPVELLGLSAAPEPGDELVVVDSEARAREVTEYRSRKRRESRQAATSRLPSKMLRSLSLMAAIPPHITRHLRSFGYVLARQTLTFAPSLQPKMTVSSTRSFCSRAAISSASRW